MAEGMILGLPLEEYVNDPAPEPSLSHGVAHELLTYSPHHAWVAHPRLNPAYESSKSSRFDIGTFAHALLLENDRSRLVVIEEDDWKKKAAREARDLAWSLGQLPLLADKVAQLDAMVAAARAQIAAIPELRGVFTGGDPEVTCVWQERDRWVRTRPDWLTSDRRIWLDYKTTDAAAEPNAWSRGVMVSQGYELQAELGRRAARALAGRDDITFVFLAQETWPPYALSAISLQPSFWAYAERRLDLALDLWDECLTTNTWPCYPKRIAYAEPPSWLTYRLEEQAVAAGMTRERGEGSVDEL